ncbi:MAG: DUF4430 domain-containing protein [Streptococcaceae bacterium]|jgi:hypothetical protein|nr:DUF4430 domain-containing protein [Streptococcaceae bacterium]
MRKFKNVIKGIFIGITDKGLSLKNESLFGLEIGKIMKRIKKWVLTVSVVLVALGLSACSSAKTSTASSSVSQSSSIVSNQIKIQIVIGKTTTSYEVKKGTNLLDFAVAKLGAKESSGFLNSINGLKTSSADKIYLMFKVNGKDSQVGAKDVILKAGDTIEFYTTKG